VLAGENILLCSKLLWLGVVIFLRYFVLKYELVTKVNVMFSQAVTVCNQIEIYRRFVGI